MRPFAGSASPVTRSPSSPSVLTPYQRLRKDDGTPHPVESTHPHLAEAFEAEDGGAHLNMSVMSMARSSLCAPPAPAPAPAAAAAAAAAKLVGERGWPGVEAEGRLFGKGGGGPRDPRRACCIAEPGWLENNGRGGGGVRSSKGAGAKIEAGEECRVEATGGRGGGARNVRYERSGRVGLWLERFREKTWRTNTTQ